MTFRASFLYAERMLFSRNKTSQKKSHGKRTLLGACLCIGISLIPLVAILVISDGMIEGITGRMIGLSSRDLCVLIDADSYSVKDYDSFIDASNELLELEDVVSSYPEIQSTALASGKKSRTGATVRAVQNDIFTSDKNFSSLFNVVEGTTTLSDGKDAVIGQKLAEMLDLHAEDNLRLITVSSQSKAHIIPKVTTLKIKGIVSCGYQELDALWIFIPLETGFKILPKDSSSYCIGLKTFDPFSKSLYQTQGRIQSALYGNENIDSIESAYVYRWDEMNASEYENFSSTQALLLLIMLLIVLVASVNISSALVMIVMERRKEIAILKSVGGTAGGITTAFLLTGFAAGLGGVIFGIPLGLLAAVNINGIISFMEKIVNICAEFVYLLGNANLSSYTEIHLLDPAYYLQSIPVSVPFKELFIIASGTLLLSLIVSAIPAVKAGKEKPLDTLRKM